MFIFFFINNKTTKQERTTTTTIEWKNLPKRIRSFVIVCVQSLILPLRMLSNFPYILVVRYWIPGRGPFQPVRFNLSLICYWKPSYRRWDGHAWHEFSVRHNTKSIMSFYRENELPPPQLLWLGVQLKWRIIMLWLITSHLSWAPICYARRKLQTTTHPAGWIYRATATAIFMGESSVGGWVGRPRNIEHETE